jgi:CheY-like chemotaxis protein
MAKVLLIDDDPDDREIYSTLLYYNGFDVVVADDGQTGIELARAEKPDVIIVDVMMPGMNGLVTANSIHTNPETADIPIYCMSAYDVSPNRVREAGAVELLPKPVGGDTLVRVIRRQVGWDDTDTSPPKD